MSFTTGLPAPTIRLQSKSNHSTPIDHFGSSSQLELSWTGGDLEDKLSDETVVLETTESVAQSAEAAPLIRRAYPLVFDDDSPFAPVLLTLSSAVQESAKAIENYSDGDLEGVGSRLAFIAALMSQAHPHTEFNPALGAMVSFVRRATLFANSTEVNLPQLMSLAKAIRQVHENPLISLDYATDLIDELKAQSWIGANPAVAEFVSALFEENQDSNSNSVEEGVMTKVTE